MLCPRSGRKREVTGGNVSSYPRSLTTWCAIGQCCDGSCGRNSASTCSQFPASCSRQAVFQRSQETQCPWRPRTSAAFFSAAAAACRSPARPCREGNFVSRNHYGIFILKTIYSKSYCSNKQARPFFCS